ncbi:MAG TPA: V-type ATP synthase subunit D [Verrucomicrobiae bacterium]
MATLNVAPTKSNLLSLKRQLAFAEEGYDLLEQKRQILILELMSRLKRAQAMEQELEEFLRQAYAALREATFASGADELDQAALSVKCDHELTIAYQHLLGLLIPKVTVRVTAPDAPLGGGNGAASTDVALLSFVRLLPKLAELAELQTTLQRLARDLRKTQRRCNALSRIFIPAYRQTIGYIAGTLEEREREALTVLKMVRNRIR